MEGLEQIEFLLLNEENEQENLRNCLYQYISERKLASIREKMSSLSLHDRQQIVSYHLTNTSLLAHAIVDEAVEITRYFITDCNASVIDSCIENGDWFPPLYLAVKSGCLPMVVMLLKYGAKDIWFDDEQRNAIVCACQANNMIIAYVLFHNGSNINCNKNVSFCLSNISYFKRSLELGTDINYTTTHGNNIFIEATFHYKYDLVKLLKTKKVDIFYRNEEGMNALDVLIWNRKSEMVSFLLKENVYSISDVILSYDYCGAQKVLAKEFRQGVQLWLKALKLRKDYSDENNYEAVPCDELSNLEIEYDEDIAFTTKKIRRALEIFLQTLSPQNPFSKKVFCQIAFSDYYNEKNSFLFLGQLFRFNNPEDLPEESAVSYSARAAIKLSEQAMNPVYRCRERCVNVFEQLVVFIRKYMRPFLTDHQKQVPHYFSLYKYLLFVVLKYLEYFLTDKSSLEENDLVTVLTNNISSPYYLKHYPTSLLLQAIARGFSLRVISLLVEYKLNLQDVDENFNTPLHLVAQIPNNRQEIDKIAMVLISAGSNLQAENIIGYTPVDYFQMQESSNV